MKFCINLVKKQNLSCDFFLKKAKKFRFLRTFTEDFRGKSEDLGKCYEGI
jgi:hypothetical protein